MITVNEAEKIISAHLKIFPAELRPLTGCYGAVLREDIIADRDQPAFDKALLDGIAINLSSWQVGDKHLKLEGTQAAGKKALRLKDKTNGCIKIMTGAVVPEGCDCVVPVEILTILDKAVRIHDADLKPGQNIRPQRSDRKKGDLLLKAGVLLLPPKIAVAASVGKAKLKVSKRAKVAIISNGDELVDIDKKLIKPFEIRKSNSYALDAVFQQTGLCETKIFHFPDNKPLMLRGIKKILSDFDILVLSGGVSMGEFDYIPQVLKKLKVEVLFHKVKQKPGKPFWFGKNKQGKVVFALPGNPVSTQVCAYRYVVPYLKQAAGLEPEAQSAILGHHFTSPTDFACFLPVKMRYNEFGQFEAIPAKTGGSGDYSGLTGTDGFVELTGGQKDFLKGYKLPFYPWKT